VADPREYSETAMERSRWSDERLDDLVDEMRRGFDRVDHDIRELRQLMFRMTLGMTLGFVTVLAAIIAAGG
jgi:hypothetical protein